MSRQFVEAIANSLESWDNSRLSNKEYYYYLSWSGDMISSPAFNELTNQSQIINANNAEGSAVSPATSMAQGTNNCN